MGSKFLNCGPLLQLSLAHYYIFLSSKRCITANDDAGGNLGVCEINERASKVRWDTTAGETYYILVHGYLPTRFGDFQINFVSSAPLNNVCENTEDINVGDTIVGTTFQSDIPFSGDFNDNVSPQWYVLHSATRLFGVYWDRIRHMTTVVCQQSPQPTFLLCFFFALF